MLWAKFLLAVACLAAMALTQDDQQFYDDAASDMTPMFDDPSAGSSDSSSNPLGVIGIVSLWPKGSQERHQERPRPDRCPKWSDWKNVTCWWPSMSFTDLPKECTYMPLPKKVPKVVQDLIRGKAQEAYDAIIFEYEQRGKPPKCGYCSRSFKCRSRNMTKDDENSVNDFERRHHRHGGRGHQDQCKPKEIQPVHDECDDHSPCELTKENGICKTPFFLNPAKINRVRDLIKQRDHQGAADELFASINNDENRRKRQAEFNDDYGSDVYGMNPQFDSPNRFGDGGRRGPFGRRQGPPEQFGPDSENDNEQFGPRYGPSFGPRGDREGPMPPPFGPPRNDDRQGSDERRGRQGPPPFFGPRDEGQRSPFGPRQDDRRGPFEPDGRHGRQGPPPPPPFDPRDDEDRHGPPPPPFGPGGDDRMGPFGPRGWGPYGPGSRRGRHGPPPPPFGGDDRRGREWHPRPWGPPGRGNYWQGPGRFGGNQENEDMNQRQTSMWNGINRGKDSHGFVYRLLHETNCVNANDTCLCCCGPYIPNVVNKTCEDLRQLFPGIEDTAEALMGIVDGQDSELPVEPPMEPEEIPFLEMPTPQRRNNPDGPSGPVKVPKPDHDF